MQGSNLEIYEQCREVPSNAKRAIMGGNLKGKTDINPMWRIKKLTELFGPVGFGWVIRTKDRWLDQGANGEVIANVCIELKVKVDDEWSEPIEGIGGNVIVMSTKNGLQSNDEAYKMAYTDAISVACKSLGIGADVYWEADATKYTNNSRYQANEQKAPSEPRKTEQWENAQANQQKAPNQGNRASMGTLQDIGRLMKAKNVTLNDILDRFGKNPKDMEQHEAIQVLGWLNNLLED